jgi:formyl-CoA transferase
MLDTVHMEDGTSLTVPGVIPKLSKSPGKRNRNAPRLGQDTEQVLREIGLRDDQIKQMIERGIVEAH